MLFWVWQAHPAVIDGSSLFLFQLRPIRLAVALATPAKTEVFDHTGLPGVEQQEQRTKNHGALLQRCVWLAEWMAQRPLHENGAWGADSFGEVARNGNAHRRNACPFNCTCDQPHGPIAKPSSWRQKCKIDAISAQLCRHFGRSASRQRRDQVAFDMPHEAKMSRRK